MELQEKHVSNTTCCTQNAVIFTLEIDFNALLQKESFVMLANMGTHLELYNNESIYVVLSYSSPPHLMDWVNTFFTLHFLKYGDPFQSLLLLRSTWCVQRTGLSKVPISGRCILQVHFPNWIQNISKWTLSLEQSTQSDNCVQKRYGTFSSSSVLRVLLQNEYFEKGRERRLI